jgi:hypothetical protein
MTEPTTLDEPRAAHLEIVEQHDGEKYDARTPIKPNLLRVNGIPLWCSASHGITIAIDGCEPEPLVANLRLQARALRLGGEPTGAEPSPAAPPGERPHFARIEVPGLSLSARPGAQVDARFVIVDGHRLLIRGCVEVNEILVDQDIVTVDVPLVCRTIVFDDEVLAPAG